MTTKIKYEIKIVTFADWQMLHHWNYLSAIQSASIFWSYLSCSSCNSVFFVRRDMVYSGYYFMWWSEDHPPTHPASDMLVINHKTIARRSMKYFWFLIGL